MTVLTRELPLFPLPEVVLFPTAGLPLHIFEPRYRQMLTNIMERDRSFGVLLWHRFLNAPARVGCTAEVLQMEKLPNGRSNIFTIGRKRFRVLRIVQESPYLVGCVEEFDEEQPAEGDLDILAADVEALLRDVLRLSAKLKDRPVPDPDDIPDEPVELSYWVASSLIGLPSQQQALLEIGPAADRLSKEIEILSHIRKELAARTALKDALG